MKSKGLIGLMLSGVLVLSLVMIQSTREASAEAKGKTVKISETLISHTLINATPEEVVGWLGTDGEGFNLDPDTQVVTYNWYPDYQEKLLDGGTFGIIYEYTLLTAGRKFTGTGVELPMIVPGRIVSVSKFSGDMDATFTSIVTPAAGGAKLILIDEYTLEAPAHLGEKIIAESKRAMDNAVKIIKEKVEKKKAGG